MSNRSAPRWLTVGAALAGVLWGAAAAHGQRPFREEHERHPGGSIRYGSRPPLRIAPVVPPGAVRYEHYREHEHDRDRFIRPAWGVPPYGGGYRNPYAEAYFRRFRPGYRPIVVGSTQYYLYPSLPPVYQSVVVNGTAYYFAEGVYYQPYISGGQTAYMVVPPPLP